MSSSIRSWLSPSRSPRRERSAYELPVYNSTMPVTAFPPPPITASMQTTTILRSDQGNLSGRLVSPPNVSDDMLVLQRRERELQHILQDLLDSQAEGLLAGLGAEMGSGRLSASSLTPTSSFQDPNGPLGSPYAGSRMLSPRSKRKLGLGRARKEIYRRMLDCAALKNEEDILIQTGAAADQEILSQLHTWEDKHEGLTAQIARIENEDSVGKRMEEMRSEAKSLENEISDLEIRLLQLKQRHKSLETQMAELSNQTDCELASWKSTLNMLDRDIGRFLAHPPTRRQRLQSEDSASTFLSLPAHRRTLAMAREYWHAATVAATKERKLIHRDKKALEDGAVVWKAVVTEILSFERTLLSSMSSDLHEEGLESLAAAMDQVTTVVEAHFNTARTKKWNLLVVAIAAELEALKQGREMLQQSILANTDLLEDDYQPSSKGDSTHAGPVRDHQRTRSVVVDHSTNGGLEASTMGGVAVPQTPTARVFSSQNRRDMDQGSSPPLVETGLHPHSAALHASMYDTDDDPHPSLLIGGKGTDTETDDD